MEKKSGAGSSGSGESSGDGESREEGWRRRGFVIKELIETEELYCDDVQRFLRYFLPAFRAQDRPIKRLFMAKPDLVSLCANLEQIAVVSRHLIEELKEAVRRVLPFFNALKRKNKGEMEITLWCATRSSVGPVLQRFTGMLQLYAQFASNYSLSHSDMRFFLKDHSFGEIWEECAQQAFLAATAEAVSSPTGGKHIGPSELPSFGRASRSKRASYKFNLSDLEKLNIEIDEEGKSSPSNSQGTKKTNSLGTIGTSRSDPALTKLTKNLALPATTTVSAFEQQRIPSPSPSPSSTNEGSTPTNRAIRQSELRITTSVERRATGQSTRLDGYLILPIQRLPRYEMLLKELIKWSLQGGAPPDSEEFLDWEMELQEIRDSLEEVEAAAAHMNEAIRMSENRQTLRELQLQFVQGTKIDLMGESSNGSPRALIREGELVKIGRNGHVPYYFHLLSDVLIYSRRTSNGLELHRVLTLDSNSSVEEAPAPNSSSYISYTSPAIAQKSTSSSFGPSVKDLIALWSGRGTDSRFNSNKKYLIKDDPSAATASGSGAAAPKGEVKKSTAFQVVTKAKSFVVYATTYKAKAVWMKDIRNVIQLQKEKRSSARNRSFMGTYGIASSKNDDQRARADSKSSVHSDNSTLPLSDQRLSDLTNGSTSNSKNASSSSSGNNNNNTTPLKPAPAKVNKSPTKDVSDPDTGPSTCKLCGVPFGVFRKKFQCKHCGVFTCSSCTNRTRVFIGDTEPERVCFLCCWEMDGTTLSQFSDHMRLSVQVNFVKGTADLETLIEGDCRELLKRAYFAVSSPSPIQHKLLENTRNREIAFSRGPSSIGQLNKDEGRFVIPVPIELEAFGSEEPFVLVHMFVLGLGEVGFARVPLLDLFRQNNLVNLTANGGVSETYYLKLRPSVAAQLGIASGLKSGRSRSRSAILLTRSTNSESGNSTDNNVDNRLSLNISFLLVPPPNLFVPPNAAEEKPSHLEELDLSDKAIQPSAPIWSDPETWRRLEHWKAEHDAHFPFSLVPPCGGSDSAAKKVLTPKPGNGKARTNAKNDSGATEATVSFKPRITLLKLYEETCEQNPNGWSVILANILYGWSMENTLFPNRDQVVLSNALATFHKKPKVAEVLQILTDRNQRGGSLVDTLIFPGKSAAKAAEDSKPPTLGRSTSRRKSFGDRAKTVEPLVSDLLKEFAKSEKIYVENLETLLEAFVLPFFEVSGSSNVVNGAPKGVRPPRRLSSGGMSTGSSTPGVRIRKQATGRFTNMFAKAGIDESDVKAVLSRMEVTLLLNSVQQFHSMHAQFLTDLENNTESSLEEIEALLRGFFALLKVYYTYAASYCTVREILLGTGAGVDAANRRKSAFLGGDNEWAKRGAAFASPFEATKAVMNSPATVTEAETAAASAASRGTISSDTSIGQASASSSTSKVTSFEISDVAREGIRRLVESCESEPRCQGRSLEFYLSAPLQRVSTYSGLLQSLSEIAPNPASFEKISKSLDESLRYLTKAILAKPNLDYLTVVSANMAASIPDSIRLVNVHRWLIREGYLVKRCRWEDKLFKFWLFCDCIIYARKLGKNKYSFNRIIWLRDAAVRDLGSDGTTARGTGDRIGDNKNAFELISMNKSFVCMIPNNMEFAGSIVGVGGFGIVSTPLRSRRNSGVNKTGLETKWGVQERSRTRIEWVSDIAKCIEIDASRGKDEIICWAPDIPLLESEKEEEMGIFAEQAREVGDGSLKVKRRMSRKFTQEERIGMAAPVLEINSKATNCNVCSRAFSIVLPSYNCRNCGKLVCGKCSREKRLLEHIDTLNLLRVCDNCVRQIEAST